MGATPKPAQSGFAGSAARSWFRTGRGLSRSTALLLTLCTAAFGLIHYTLKSPRLSPTLSVAPVAAQVAAPTLLEPTTTSSCEVCLLEPTNPLCRYGLDNIRLSRAYEGSGHRLRKVLRRALAGEEIGVGVLGASVTAGHAVPPGEQRWEDRFFEDFQRFFPNAKMHVGAAPAMDSQFFAYCAGAMIPTDLDIYLVELDINNDVSFNTMQSDDALMRSLLDQPQEPAVLRVSVFTLLFDELVRGASSGLITSQFFDVPVISLRGFLLPYLIHHREKAPEGFGIDYLGTTDYRHISAPVHRTLGDMLSLFVQKEICETRRRAILDPAGLPRTRGLWLEEDDLGRVPNQTLWSSWLRPAEPRQIAPLCHSLGSPRSPFNPLSHSKTFKIEEWNGKTAWVSSLPGSQIRMHFTGSRVGLFVYVSNGGNPEEQSDDPAVRRRHAPGSATCWIEDAARGQDDRGQGGETDTFEVDSYLPSRSASGFNFVELADDLAPGEHILACEVSKTSSSGGYKWRLQGIASY